MKMKLLFLLGFFSTSFCLAQPNNEEQIQGLATELQAEARKQIDKYRKVLAGPPDQRAIYAQVDDGIKQPIFSLPGFVEVQDCERANCKVVSSVDHQFKMVPTGNLKFTERETSDGEKELVAFYEVRVPTTEGKFELGWIPKEQSTSEKLDPSILISEQINARMEANRPSTILQAYDKVCRFFSGLRIGSNQIYTPNMSDVHSVSKKAIEEARSAKESVAVVAEKMSGLVGRCVLSPANQISEAKLKGPINYDTLVLPYMTGLKYFSSTRPASLAPLAGASAPSVKQAPISSDEPLMLQARDLNIPGLNAQSLLEIDSLSRTIFAEMAKCEHLGSQYLMAVARVIKNRGDAVDKNLGALLKKSPKAEYNKRLKAGEEFINSEERHWPGKNTATKVSSSPVQFSAWNSYVIDFDKLKAARRAEVIRLSSSMPLANARKKAQENIKPDAETRAYYKFNESGLLQALCPPSDINKEFYSGGKPSASLHTIWRNTLRVAVEAVLYPKQFAARTSNLSKVRHYTSDRKKFYNFVQVNPMVDGRSIDNNRCLNLWVDPKK